MAAVKIGANAAIFSTRANADFYFGQAIQNLRKALQDAANAKLLADQLVDADFVALGYGDGNNGTANEVGYLRSGLLAGYDLNQLRFGLSTMKTIPYVYENDLKYVCQQ